MAMRKIALGVALLATAVIPVGALAQTMDHMTCLAVKDSAPRARYQATLTTAGGAQSCIVRAPAKLACVPTAKSDVTPTPPGGGPSASTAGAFLCYRAKCPKTSTSENAQDQFGNRVVLLKAARYLCAPANVGAPTPGLPATSSTTLGGGPTTTSTTLPGQNGCTFTNGQCTGSCGAGMRCGAAVGSTSCACRAVACGDADTPQCNGACPQAGQACVFDLTGCSCVRIP
jgi:hypothetical protein